VDGEKKNEILRVLSAGEWFGTLSPSLQDLILSRSIVRKYARGQVISVEESPPDFLLGVLEGSVYVVRDVGGGEESLIHVGEPGFWYGAVHLLTGSPTVATLLAHTPVRALILSKAQFDRILAEDPRHYPAFAKLALDRYRVLVSMFAELRELAPEARLRGRLASLAKLRMQDRRHTGAVSLAVSQADLARMVGVSRQTLNALLGKLSKAGLIEVGFRRIRVLDAARLVDPNAPPAEAVRGTADARRSVRLPSRPAGKRAE
jgi:CRP-like cAMP-binding protein